MLFLSVVRSVTGRTL